MTSIRQSLVNYYNKGSETYSKCSEAIGPYYQTCENLLARPAKALNKVMFRNRCDIPGKGLINTAGGMGIIGYLSTKVVRYVGPKIVAYLSPAMVARIGLQSFNPATAVFLSITQAITYSFSTAFIPNDTNKAMIARYVISIIIPAAFVGSMGIAVTPGALFLLHGGNFIVQTLAAMTDPY
jgi:hypothetical protein